MTSIWRVTFSVEYAQGEREHVEQAVRAVMAMFGYQVVSLARPLELNEAPLPEDQPAD